MKRIVSFIAAVVAGLWLITANALGLGEIDVRSHLNQRFDAIIPLTSVGADEAADLRVSLASAEDFLRAGVERVDYLSSLRFAVRTDGTPRIEISSDKLEREPYLRLLLEVHAGGNRILRQYTVLLDPPGMASSAPLTPAPRAVTPLSIAPTAAAVVPAPVAPVPVQRASSEPSQSIFVEVDHPAPPADERRVTPRSEPVEPVLQPKRAAPVKAPAASTTANAVFATAPATGELYGPVKAGETLWSIATRVRGNHTDISMDQVLLSLYNSNSRAFDGGGINGLHRGAMLSVPAVADMRALDAADAHRDVARLRGLPAGAATAATPHARKPVIEPVRITPPPPASSAAGIVHAAPAAPQTKPDAADVAVAATPVASSASDGAVATDHAASSTPAATDATQAHANPLPESAAAAVDAAAGNAGAVAPDEPESAVPQVAVPAVEPVKPVQTKKAESLLQVLLIPLILGLLLLFFLGWLYARWRARRAVPPAPPVQSQTRMPLSTSLASETILAGAAAATQKLTPQEELDRLQASISGRTQDVDTQQLQQTQQLGVDPAGTSETPAAAADLPPVDFDLTGQFAAQTVQIDLDANDPVSEADFHLAYGLYDEAALLLRQAAEKEPQRTDIGIKLAETYFAAGKTAEFAQTTAELKPKLSAAEWQKLAIMGQQLDPDAVQFSGAAATPLQTDLNPDFSFDVASASTTSAAASADDNALDFNFDGELVSDDTQHEVAAPIDRPAADGLDFKLDDLELPSLDVDKHDTPAAAPLVDSNTLDFDLGSFDTTPAPAAAPMVTAAEVATHDATSTLDFDLDGFDVGADASSELSASPAAVEPAAELPIEEFDFGAVSTEATDLAGDEAATKLDLARAYLEMGDNEMARGLLDEVLEQGNAQQKQDAKSLVDRLA